MKEKVSNFLKHSEIAQNIIKSYFGSKDYKIDYFVKSREEFLDIFKTRLRISKTELKIRQEGEELKRLKDLVDTFNNSSDDRILCIGINDFNLSLYTNLALTKIFGYII